MTLQAASDKTDILIGIAKKLELQEAAKMGQENSPPKAILAPIPSPVKVNHS